MLAQVAVADIGAVAVRVLEDESRFASKRFDLASDELTGNDAVGILSRVTGRPFTYHEVPLDLIRQRMGEDTAKMYAWFDRVGYTVDRAALLQSTPPSNDDTTPPRLPRWSPKPLLPPAPMPAQAPKLRKSGVHAQGLVAWLLLSDPVHCRHGKLQVRGTDEN
jgi:hypothetical protein